jgi:hypothetical protein
MNLDTVDMMTETFDSTAYTNLQAAHKFMANAP